MNVYKIKYNYSDYYVIGGSYSEAEKAFKGGSSWKVPEKIELLGKIENDLDKLNKD